MLRRIVVNLSPDPNSVFNSIVNGAKFGALLCVLSSLIASAILGIIYILH